MSNVTIPSITLNNGSRMPQFGLGTWKSQPGEVKTACYEALKCGYTHIDAAHIYGNESEVGEGISQAVNEGIISKDDIFVTSKVWNTHHAPNDVVSACELTLKNLGLKQLDLYLIHWPICLKKEASFPLKPDDFTDIPLQDTWKAMESLVEKGLVKAIGVSNFNIERIKEVLGYCKIKPVMNQVECHPYLNQHELKSFCNSNGIYITAYSPLGSPDRPSARFETGAGAPPPLMEDETLKTLAEKYQVTSAQILIKFQLKYGNIVIPKSVTPSRIKANLESLKIELSDEDMDKIKALNCGLRYIDGKFFMPEGTSGPIKELKDLWG